MMWNIESSTRCGQHNWCKELVKGTTIFLPCQFQWLMPRYCANVLSLEFVLLQIMRTLHKCQDLHAFYGLQRILFTCTHSIETRPLSNCIWSVWTLFCWLKCFTWEIKDSKSGPSLPNEVQPWWRMISWSMFFFESAKVDRVTLCGPKSSSLRTTPLWFWKDSIHFNANWKPLITHTVHALVPHQMATGWLLSIEPTTLSPFAQHCSVLATLSSIPKFWIVP